MGLKLYIKEHISYVLFQIILTGFVLSIYWLDGFRNVSTAIYSISISMLLVLSYLAVRYIFRRHYYDKIVELPESMEEALHKNAKTPEHELTEQYLHELYRIYQYEVQALYSTQTRHNKFMNQWIHQMKTPLSVLELLLQEPGELDKKSVQEEIDRLKRGLDMVLMNARLENFESDMQIEQVYLKQCITSIVNENKRLFITNRVFPDVQIDENIIIMSDSKWLKFTISQFITNSVKYTFEPNKKIKIIARQVENSVQLTIEDEGIGIPKSDLTRVTKPFFTGENGRKTAESTGMGLYLANEICHKLNHQLEIESTVEKGTTIKITFL